MTARLVQRKAKIVLLALLLLFIGGELGGLFGPPVVAALERKLAALATSEWETYRNEEFGFLVKYPGGWEMAGNKETAGASKEVQKRFSISSGGLSFEIFLLPATEERKELFSALLQAKAGSAFVRKGLVYAVQERLMVSSVPLVPYYVDRGLHSRYRNGLVNAPLMGEALLQKGQTMFHFMLTAQEEELRQENREVFGQFLSTFRFEN